MRVVEGDLFEEPLHGEDVLVCPVNLVGTMGKGMALQFKKRYNWVETSYKEALNEGVLDVGMNHYVGGFPCVMFFASKRHWRDPSQKDDIVRGLVDLKRFMKRYPAMFIRLPAVGCGEGGLSFLWLEEQCWTLFSGLSLDLYRPK